MSEIRAIIPPDMAAGREDWKMSPAISANGFLFLTGMTGRNPDGTVPAALETQMVSAFDKVVEILHEAGCDVGDIIEMTTYHRNLHENLDLVREVRGRYVREPYPAWTAIEVSGFTHPDTVFEVRVVARQKENEGDK